MKPLSARPELKNRESGSEALILFTRLPNPGKAKTRLIHALGAVGAANLQREMTEHTIRRIRSAIFRRKLGFEICFTGGPAPAMRNWLGQVASLRPQGDGDLGQRLHRAASSSFDQGARSVVIIGADCPDLDSRVIEAAFEALRDKSIVFGPARDGGYYLVGLRSPMSRLFQGIPWSTNQVLSRSLSIARRTGIEPALLPELADVDEPTDLSVWENARRASQTLSVVLPTLNEAAHLEATLQSVAAGKPFEIIVADGGSSDATIFIAREFGATVVESPRGRGRQMNAGAALACGENLLFLHADTLLPTDYERPLASVLKRLDVSGGAFGFAIADSFPGRSAVEQATNLRSRLGQMPYGDQGIFTPRWVFEHLGGFPDLPLMEDYEFVRRLRRFGHVATLNVKVLTSGRRWRKLGVIRTTLLNHAIVLAYRLGIPPQRLASLYRQRDRSG